MHGGARVWPNGRRTDLHPLSLSECPCAGRSRPSCQTSLRYRSNEHPHPPTLTPALGNRVAAPSQRPCRWRREMHHRMACMEARNSRGGRLGIGGGSLHREGLIVRFELLLAQKLRWPRRRLAGRNIYTSTRRRERGGARARTTTGRIASRLSRPRDAGATDVADGLISSENAR